MDAPVNGDAADLSRRLARDAESVCRHYLSNGRREGRYWLVGDVANTPGRSLYVRLRGADDGGKTGKGAAGKWTDAATGEHGDLLDLIALNRNLSSFRDVLDEARAFLSLPRRELEVSYRHPSAPRGSPGAARRLFAMSRPLIGTLAETYLRTRRITRLRDTECLRFHPRCYYRPSEDSPPATWPAMIAAVTDLDGRITGAHRTWLNRTGDDKAPIETPRRAMGDLLGHGVRFGAVDEVLAAGEGIETVLSIRCVAPTLPMIAALSAAHLAVIVFPPTLRRLYIVRDADPAGDVARERLTNRADAAGIGAITLSPQRDDFNADLRAFGADAVCAMVRTALTPGDVARFMDV